MATDLVALKTALETDMRYDTVVTGGRNRELLVLLAAEEPGQTVFLSVPSAEVLDAIGDGVRSLTTEALAVLRLYTGGAEVDFRKAAIRAELLQVFAGQGAVIKRVTAIARRTRTYGEEFNPDGAVSLRDLWAVLKLIPKSYMATKLAQG